MHAAHVNYVHLSIVINVTLSFFGKNLKTFHIVTDYIWNRLKSQHDSCATLCLKEKEKKSNNFLTYCLVNFLVMNSLIFLSTNAPVAVILDLVMLWGKNSKIVFIVWGNNILINGKTNCNKNRDDPNARYIIIQYYLPQKSVTSIIFLNEILIQILNVFFS